jgi:hypothetical protein
MVQLTSNFRQIEQSQSIKTILGTKKDLLVKTYDTGDNYYCCQIKRPDKYTDSKESGIFIPKVRIDTIWELIQQWPKPNNPLTNDANEIPDECKIRAESLQTIIIMKFNLKCTIENFTTRENRCPIEYPYYQYPLYILQNMDMLRKGRVSWRLV